MRHTLTLCVALAIIFWSWNRAAAQVTVFHDRGTFTTAMAAFQHTASDTYETYAPGPIFPGDPRGDFRYTFDPSLTQPAVVPDGSGGQALGGSPFDVFVGGDSVTLTLLSGHVLAAFGADFSYAPSFDVIPSDTYRLGISDGPAAGAFAGSLDSIDPNGGTFFLGLIAAPGYAFTGVSLFSVQQDPSFLVPAYQVDNLIYAVVPEPESFVIVAIGILAGFVTLVPTRRKLRCRSL